NHILVMLTQLLAEMSHRRIINTLILFRERQIRIRKARRLGHNRLGCCPLHRTVTPCASLQHRPSLRASCILRAALPHSFRGFRSAVLWRSFRVPPSCAPSLCSHKIFLHHWNQTNRSALFYIVSQTIVRKLRASVKDAQRPPTADDKRTKSYRSLS